MHERATRGCRSELIAAEFFLKHGYEVFRAVCFTTSCDLVVIPPGNSRPFKVEVRTGRLTKKGKPLYSWVPRRDEGRSDMLAIVIPEINAVHLLTAATSGEAAPLNLLSTI